MSPESERVKGSRDAARKAAIRACRTMLDQLRQHLSGEPLQGLPNIGRSSRLPYRALPVRVQSETSWTLKPPGLGEDWGKASLVLTETGELVQAATNGRGDIHAEPVRLEDLMAEDVEHLAETISEALRLHLSKSERKARAYDELRELADRIVAALEGTRP